MNLRLELFIKPVPHQSVRMTRSGHAYQPKKIVDYKSEIKRLVGEQLPTGFSAIVADTPIFVTKLHYVFQYPKSFSKAKRQSIVYKHTKPDLHDNLNKALFDALEGVVWERDQNVVSMNDVSKYYGPEDKIIIEIAC